MNRHSLMACHHPHGRRVVSLATCLLLFLLTAACDGGIFGTGDGDDAAAVIQPDMSTGSSGADPVDSPSGGDGQGDTTDGATTAGTTSDGATTDGQAENPDATDSSPIVAFNNSVNSTGRGDALLRLVNASLALEDSIVATLNRDRDTPLLQLPGLNYLQGSSGYLSVPTTETTSIELIPANDFSAGMYESSKILQPLELVAGSVTTLIVRETLKDFSREFEILPAVTLSTTGNSNASLRVIHAAKSLANGNAVDIFLLPSGGTREQAVAGYTPLDYTSQPESAYVEVEPGQYAIQFDSVGSAIGISSNVNPIELIAGRSVTLVIRDTQTGTPGQDIDVLILEDSQLP